MAGMSLAQRLKFASSPQAYGQAKSTSLVSPIKGWNTRDALDAMDPLDAIQLDNFFPDGGGCAVRNGYRSYATNVGGGPVKTVAEFNAGLTRKFLAAASGGIYDISGGGAIAAPLASGFSDDAWQTANFLSRLFFVNGADIMQVFDGAVLANGAFTGVSLSTLVGVWVYQQRLFFWQKNSTGFWYAQLNSINGALAFYDLATFTPRGGNLIAVTSMSQDGGAGVQDFIVFIMSSGDCLIFVGNDPSNLNAWSEVGRFRISPPVSIRAVCNYGAEAFLTTFDDHVPLHQELVALKLGQLAPRSKASGAVQAAVIANPSGFGWEALYYPRGRRLIFNIPNPDGSFSQHIQNTASADQPWCGFTGMNAFCFGLFRDLLYFGGQGGNVYQADVGNLDLTAPITATAQQAWNSFKSPLRKQITAVRPIFQAFQSASYSFGLGFDYGQINIRIDAASGSAGSPWDTSPWDTSPWSVENVINTRWNAGAGNGTAVGMKLTIASIEGASWLRTDLKFQVGNAL